MSAKKVKIKPSIHKSRKQLRKEERKNKKLRRYEYYTNRRKPGAFVLAPKQIEPKNAAKKSVFQNKPKNEIEKKKPVNKPPTPVKVEAEEVRDKEKKQHLKLQKEMNKQRNKQLLEANFEEDRNIKRLEKQLKLHKRKSKAVPASFTQDGLDYLLEVCDPENLKTSALAEQQLTEVNDEFEEDFALITGDTTKRKDMITDEDSLESGNDIETDISDEESEVIEHEDVSKSKKRSSKTDRIDNKKHNKISEDSFDDLEEEEDIEEDNNFDSLESGNDDISSDIETDKSDEQSEIIEQEDVSKSKKRSSKTDRIDNKKMKKYKINADNLSDDLEDEEDIEEDNTELKTETNDDGTWEDIYGRLRAKDGSLINAKTDKYIPPGARLLNESNSSDKARAQKLDKLKKQLKGLINRLAESNMHSIASQIEDLYMSNSRNDMNSTITNLVLEALVSPVITPERLLMEHVLLIVILHANVGTEVGAHFLQTVVKQFDESLRNITNTENKKLDNIIIILAQLYNFKLFDSKLIYEIVNKLIEDFGEKEVECILHILRNVGFNLRKDNPIALKDLILNLQKKAAGASNELKENSRVKFMLDILLAIKNNNVTKIPNYDTTYSEHLKKISKGFIRKGNYVTQLNISLQDLLKVEEKGKWWIVGSAWVGNATENENNKNLEKPNSFSQKLLELATKQRMNTDTRKNIFCIIMSAEDYLDAFEKLLRLSLKNQQEREIIHVILHCCLQEKNYNPYYATLAQKFCESDRKYQMTIKCSIWDKLKTLNEHSSTQISNLAKLLIHLFIEKGLPISTLKIVQFSELDKVTLRFIRQILLGILLHEDLDVCKGVFDKVGQSEKLKMFRESLRLFMHHFLLRNLNSQGISDEKKQLLQQRVKIVEKLLTGKENKLRY